MFHVKQDRDTRHFMLLLSPWRARPYPLRDRSIDSAARCSGNPTPINNTHRLYERLDIVSLDHWPAPVQGKGSESHHEEKDGPSSWDGSGAILGFGLR